MTVNVTEPTPIALIWASQEDYQRGKITMLKELNGKVAVHGHMYLDKIIEGEIIEKEREKLHEQAS